MMVDLQTNTASIRGHQVKLWAREAEILHVLERADDILNAQQVADIVGGIQGLTARDIWWHVHKLRPKLARTALRVDMVSGYRLRWVD